MGELKKTDNLKKGEFQVKHLFSVCLCAFLCGAIFAGTAESVPGTNPISNADIAIRFYNRTVYYPGNSPSEPILVQITITNSGPGTLRFKLADDHFFSLDFSAMNTRNQALEHTDNWTRKRSTNRQVFFRELSLESGESYSFTENVKDYVTIANPGMYILDCSFYPELKQLMDDSESSINSNRLTLEIKPTVGAAAPKLIPLSPSSGEVLQPQAIPPDQVISYLLTARQKSSWDQFFLYIDLEQMISRDSGRGRRYRAESENGRFTMIENYKNELEREKTDKEISIIPVEFKIEKTSYSDTEGTVSVLEWFDYKTFREKKRYTYYLASRNGIWRVYDYTVDNLGTE